MQSSEYVFHSQRTMRAVAQRTLRLSLAATHMSISRVSCPATVLRVPRLQPFGMPARMLCSGADISKTTLIDIYNEVIGVERWRESWRELEREVEREGWREGRRELERVRERGGERDGES